MSAKKPRMLVHCRECGLEFETTERRLAAGRGRYCSRTCGIRATGRRHGHSTHDSQSRTYNTWAAMVQRCTNPKATKYPRYGAVGIAVCPEWTTFDNFLDDMGERPEGKTLDRINSNLGYFKDNCRWATPAEQQSHLSNHAYVLYAGQRFYRNQLARHLGIDAATLIYRIRNWPESRWHEQPGPSGRRKERPLGKASAHRLAG